MRVRAERKIAPRRSPAPRSRPVPPPLPRTRARRCAVSHDPAVRVFDPTWFGKEVSGSTVGLVGFGRIGSKIGARCAAFDMRVLYHTRRASAEAGGATHVPALEDLLRESDFIVLACPATPETERIIRAETLAHVRRDSILVNIGRGSLVDQADVHAALVEGRLRCYATDVTTPEPLPADHPLRALPREKFICTPHIGSATFPTRKRMLERALANLSAVLDGREPLDPVLPPHA